MIKKVLILLIIVPILVLFVLLSIIRFSPQTVLSAVNKFSDYQVVADNVALTFFPFGLQAEQLKVTDKLAESAQTFVDVKVVSIEYDWWAKLKGKRADWVANAKHGVIILPVTSPQDKASKQKSTSTSPIDIHSILTLFKGDVEDVKIVLDTAANNYLHIERLSASLSDYSKQRYQTIEQVIDMGLVWSNNAQALPLKGVLKSYYENGEAYLQLDMPALDLSALMSSNSDTQKVDTPEAAMDWQWIDSLSGLNIRLSVGNFKLQDNALSNVDAELKFFDGIEVKNISADVNWQLTKDINFNDNLRLSGVIKPLAKITNGRDVQLQLTASTPKVSLAVQGESNINGSSGQSLNIELNATEIPVAMESESGKSLSDITKQYFPVSLKSEVLFEENQFQLKIADLKLGKSDLKGVLQANNLTAKKPKYIIKIQSNRFIHTSLPDVTSNKAVPKASEKSKQRLFSDDAIDWQWLNSYDIEAMFQVKELSYNKWQLSNVMFPISLSAGILNANNLTAKFSEGDIQASLTLAQDKKNASLAKLTSSIKLNKIKLGDLGLLPKEEITGGRLSFHSDLASVGQSLQGLVSHANGYVFLDADEAVIKNRSFELLGSDLLLELLNKLNPFSKQDKNTNLECMTAYLPIKKGKVDLNHNVALKTSKLIITGGGSVNLANEKINVKFSPAMRDGIGLSVGNLVKFIKLGGTLTEPKPAVSGSGLIATGLSVGAAASTGGLSLLAEGLVEKALNGDVCGKVRKRYSMSKKAEVK